MLLLAGSARAQEAPKDVQVRGGTKIEAELESALDTRTAKPGDEVAVRVTKDVKQGGNTVVQKGDRLVGKVEKVEQRSEGSAASSVAVRFDRIARGESTTQMSAVVSSMLAAPTKGFVRRGEAADPVPEPAPMPVAQGGARRGGGLVGGVTSTVGATAGVVSSPGGTRTFIPSTTPLEAIRVATSRALKQQPGMSQLSTSQPQLRLEAGTRMELDVR